MSAEFHHLSIKYMESIDINYRKSLGQYFTPKTVRDALISTLPKKISPLILDPACGTGEFLLSAKHYFKNPVLQGWDIDKKLIAISKKIIADAELKNVDALRQNYSETYDFVIGNPPYYEFSPDKYIGNKFNTVINGRANIFSMFIQLGLNMLKKGGYLAYVIPPSMNNGAYFSKLRDFIVKNSNIESLQILNSSDIFHKAQQSVMLLVLKKGKNLGNFLFKKNGILIFSQNANYLKEKFDGRFSLQELGFSVKTGRLVWNQNKTLLTNNLKGSIPLIWSHNITSDGLKIPIIKNKKPQYVKTNDFDIGPAIVVNRITGAASKANLKAAIVPRGMKFIAENHVNVIYPQEKQTQFSLFDNYENKISLEDIVEQLTSPEALNIIQNITGNTQISKTELEFLFPIKTKSTNGYNPKYSSSNILRHGVSIP